MEDTLLSEKYLDLLKSALCSSLYEESAWQVLSGPMRHFRMSWPSRMVAHSKHALLRFLRSRNLRLVRTVTFDPKNRENGLDWPMFGFTMTGRRRMDALHKCIENVLENDIPGDLIETGVWRGGSVILMRAVLNAHNDQNRVVWCADSFEGMPVPKDSDTRVSSFADFSDREYLAVSLDQVKSNFDKFGLLDDRVRFLKGWFSDTLPDAPIQSISLLRLDGDLYASTRDALVNLYHKVSPGGFVIVDDYNSWGGCQAAINDFRKERGITEPLVEIDSHCVLWQINREGTRVR